MALRDRLDTLAATWSRLPLRTITLPPATHTNVMLIGGGGAFLIVDPGSTDADEQALLNEAVFERFGNGEALSGVLLTHHHRDHVSGLSDLVEAITGAGHASPRVFVHPLDREASGIVEGLEVVEVSDEEVLEVGTVRLTVMHTPGHTKGHLALYDPDTRIVHAADMVASTGTIVVAPPDGDMSDYMASLARLRALDAKLMVPSHGDPIEDVGGHLDHYIAHRNMREERVFGALGDTPRTPLALVPSAYPDISPVLYPLAAMSLTAHLIKLGREGRAVEVDGRWRRG